MSIDYGRQPLANGNLPNRDPNTGIRYGIISLNELNEYTLESFEPIYTCCCPECGNEFDPGSQPDDDEPCKDCGFVASDEDEWWSDEPVGLVYEENGYSLILDEHNDVWVFKSPHTTNKWSHCSPCAPGAAYLKGGFEDIRDHDGIEEDLAYCLGPEWYEQA